MEKPVQAMYVHVPFCRNICAYCDFTRVGCNDRLIKRWLQALKEELNEKKPYRYQKTIYIGGGTPTALNMEQLNQLLCLLDEFTQVVEEYTIEVNPETLDDEKIDLLKAHGINRLSIGVQSASKRLLTLMNRLHTWEQVVDLVERLRQKGLNNLSLDCMYSLPTQTQKELQDTLDKMIALKIPHLSLYSLTIEENSEFGRKKIQPLDEDTEAELFFDACRMLKEAGYEHYEISNFALPDYQSKHNQVYWHYDDFYGIGLGASGKENHCRYQNTTRFPDYFNHQWIQEKIYLSRQDEQFEMLMMNLRLRKGLKLARFEEQFHQSFQEVFQKPLKEAIHQDWLVLQKGYLRCTDKGFAILNTVLELFLN